ncbi:expressed unknown protein [Seminavis robusta]|uniref:Uncharacterized protein n=1 Tax=Seminavis robusta TaxID=568900 RepID=A0A9N8DFG3_9STRA|nr:expressed unknown protein [Seminavis robusta]|eukprot:Sro93_g048470.1 n/a (133) ;mRNA; r:56456-56854
MTSTNQPVKMAMSIDGAKSVKIQEDDTIVFTMEDGPPIELKFVMPSVHKKEGQDEGYETPMAKRVTKVGFLSPESVKSNKSNKSENTPMPFASPADTSMGSPSPFKATGGGGSAGGSFVMPTTRASVKRPPI